MKKNTVLALLLAGSCWAAPARKVLVLETSGPSGQLVSQKSAPNVATGSILQERDTVDIKSGGSMTVLVLGKRERLRVIGPGKFTIGPEGLQEAGVKLEKLEAPDQLALSGDNHRRLAGLRTRAKGALPASGKFDSITVTPGSLCLASDKLPEKPVRIMLYSTYRGPIIDAKGIDRDEPEPLLSTELVAPVKANGQLTFTLPLPASPQELTVRVLAESGSDELLFARLYALSAAEQSELAASKTAIESWAKASPQSAEPWIVYTYMLEEKGLLREALNSLQRALELRPADAGLMEMKIRLLLDSGDYSSAMECWRAWSSTKS